MLSAVLESIRLAVGLCFVVAAWKKTRDIAGFQRGIDTFQITPASWSRWVAWTVILTEAMLALAFVGSFHLEILCWTGLMLMAGFGLVTESARRRGVVVNCNCFGASGADATSMQGWVRWMFLTAGVAVVCIGATMPSAPSSASVGQLDIWVAGACVAVACASITRLFDPVVWRWTTGRVTPNSDGLGVDG